MGIGLLMTAGQAPFFVNDVQVRDLNNDPRLGQGYADYLGRAGPWTAAWAEFAVHACFKVAPSMAIKANIVKTVLDQLGQLGGRQIYSDRAIQTGPTTKESWIAATITKAQKRHTILTVANFKTIKTSVINADLQLRQLTIKG